MTVQTDRRVNLSGAWRSAGAAVVGSATLLPGYVVIALTVLWAAHNGGYDEDTWYWGALVALSVLVAWLLWNRGRVRPLAPEVRIALIAFALYVAWSYLSIAWASAPGDALDGSNKALLYLLVFALMTVLPWTPRTALMALLTFVLSIGVIAFVMLVRLGSGDEVGTLIVGGRFLGPTGYYNSTVALFMIDALPAIFLATRRELPGALRGLLLAIATASLGLVLIGQSRGWLFTLPLVVLMAFVVLPDRLRVAAATVLPVLVVIVLRHRLLAVYDVGAGGALRHTAMRAGQALLLASAAAFFVGTIAAWAESLRRSRGLSAAVRRRVGIAVVALVLVICVGGAAAATHGHPVAFVKRQWNGFVNPAGPGQESSASHFATVGTGRYDFWRVALDGFLAHPIGGLGQDNFADYYVSRRRISQEPQWVHSLELRLLAHTGIVGFGLFLAFLLGAIAAAVRARRRDDPLVQAAAGAALLPLIVWVVHGSVDWFWELPALTGPALGFLAVAGALARPSTAAAPRRPHGALAAATSALRPLRPVAVGLALVAAVTALGFPYLSVRKTSIASDVRFRNPAAALSDLRQATDLDPLSATPTRLAGTIALQNGNFDEAEQLFHQTSDREPDGWFAWFGAGLAASALGDSQTAHHDYAVADSINTREPAIRTALARVYTTRPMTVSEAFNEFVLVQ